MNFPWLDLTDEDPWPVWLAKIEGVDDAKKEIHVWWMARRGSGKYDPGYEPASSSKAKATSRSKKARVANTTKVVPCRGVVSFDSILVTGPAAQFCTMTEGKPTGLKKPVYEWAAKRVEVAVKRQIVLDTRSEKVKVCGFLSNTRAAAAAAAEDEEEFDLNSDEEVLLDGR